MKIFLTGACGYKGSVLVPKLLKAGHQVVAFDIMWFGNFLELLPISEYNKTKMCGERIVLSYKDDMVVQIVRPATVCGFSPRQRLDVSVNMLTMQALMNGRITVFGGDQTRPNIHIDDITDLYLFLLDHPEHTGIYNAGFENISILDIANMVAKHVRAE